MLGDRIKAIRKSNKLNQVEFSRIIGVSQGTLSELELNKYYPSFETVISIIKCFNVDATWFIFGDIQSGKSSIENNMGLSSVEAVLISKYRELSVTEQYEVLRAIDSTKANKNKG
ncbi:helix-turn-helix domain-containing protein [Paenibacillus sp. YYML68]|uniref:helix-turn-helix domain-containing protein n=1 Tax=Paenibacillus sp. YYML68 TaxID=2909250 RepID=UPI0024913C7B|nr:helix-turn-helix transcriptional regulator [Paenibacillus sp. YYML68]